MKRKRVIIISMLLAVMLVLGVCVTVVWVNRPQEMPAIVFMYSRTRPDYSTGDIAFWDNCGNQYGTNDPSVCSLTWNEIYEEFTAGRLDNVLKKKKVCEPDEVYEYYKMLKKVAKNKEFDLIKYEHYPDVVTDTLYWYGMYYDKEGKLSSITLQREIRYTTEYGNDENAVKICQWLEGENQNSSSATAIEPDVEPSVETTEQAYFKEPAKEDVVIDETTGITYVKNQVLVSACPDAHEKIISEQAHKLGAEVVGYIELTNDYQFEFTEDKTLKELNEMITYLQGLPEVSYASLNLVYEQVTE